MKTKKALYHVFLINNDTQQEVLITRAEKGSEEFQREFTKEEVSEITEDMNHLPAEEGFDNISIEVRQIVASTDKMLLH